MKKIKYQISPKENMGLIPEGAIIEAYLVYKGDSNDGLVFTPPNTKYVFEGEKGIDEGCGSLTFARYDEKKNLWKLDSKGYINLDHKVLSKNKA